MNLLDWIKNRNRPESAAASDFDPKAHGHKDWKGVFAEIRHDESLARMRNETGREPPSSATAGVSKSGEDVPPFARGDRIIAHEPFWYGGKPKSNPDTPGIVDSIYNGGNTVCYHRNRMPPGNVPVEEVRHASEQDLKRYESEFSTLQSKVLEERKGLSWDR